MLDGAVYRGFRRLKISNLDEEMEFKSSGRSCAVGQFACADVGMTFRASNLHKVGDVRI
jgi:hypothetical protein